MKKAQLAAQPFMYIMGIIVVVLILTFGIKAIASIRQQAELVQVSTFVTDLNKYVETYYNLNVGSSREIILTVPNYIDMICFTAPKKPFTSSVDPNLEFILQGSDNLYLFGSQLGPRTISHLEATLEENPLCFQTRGKLQAFIETKARDREVFVEISR
ncbi:MAG: hypothetical protein Q8R00_04840 [Candidatus Nanoarchaeia archaeon]|nr:hypothetical protein [Candidatus Nanoarchaeia archaeon]